MAIPSATLAAAVAAAANLWFFWLAPYLAWTRREPGYAWTLMARSIGLVGLLHWGSFYFYQGINLLLLEGFNPCEFLSAAEASLSPPALYIRFPTLLWLGGGDGGMCSPLMLQLVVALAGLCSLCAFLGIVTPLAFLGMWTVHLSLGIASGQVLQYPWDILMSETAFLATWLPQPPKHGRWSVAEAPSGAVRLAFSLLQFRLLMVNGLMKFYDNPDTAWADWSYIKGYLEWQGFPTWAALVAYHAPMWVHHVVHCYVWFSQVVSPFMGLIPRCWFSRILALFLIMEMQGIQFMGNYGVFNVLTAVLAYPHLAPGLPEGGEQPEVNGRGGRRQRLGPDDGQHRGGGGGAVEGEALGEELRRRGAAAATEALLKRRRGPSGCCWLCGALHRVLGAVVCVALMPLGLFHVLAFLLGGQMTLGVNGMGAPEYLWLALVMDLLKGPQYDALRLAAVYRVANSVGVFRGHSPGRNAFTISLHCSGDQWHEVVPPHASPQNYGHKAAPLTMSWIAPLQSRFDQVYTHNGMAVSPNHGYNNHVFGDFYHRMKVNLMPSLLLGLLSDCCQGRAGEDRWRAMSMLASAGIPEECAGLAPRGPGELLPEAKVGVQWHRYHFDSLEAVFLEGKPPLRRGGLLREVNYTKDELRGFVRQLQREGSLLLRYQLQLEGWALRPLPPEDAGIDLRELLINASNEGQLAWDMNRYPAEVPIASASQGAETAASKRASSEL